ncbi:NAD(+)/NADH kinase [Candidatus Daviesbacteria bacterium]|nr:NAD(+)/NADH kinase [Candidatus Daviesbacteria bacterium]
MKVLLFGKNSQDIKELVENSGLQVTEQNPDVVISYGGDGTLLSAERTYPNIPKLPIRNSQFCNKCPDHQDKKVLQDLLAGKLNLNEYQKLHTSLDGKDLYALNDFVVRNQHPIHAIRFNVNGQFFIGDGIVISTPFGSTAYFKSITGGSFDEGFGLAFNNTTEKQNPVYFNEDDRVNFQLVRGQANLSFDNNPDIFNIAESTAVSFDLSDKKAKIYESSLRCPNCKVIRG